MSLIIRWALVPFLILLTVTVFALIAQALQIIGIFDVNYLLNNPLTRSLGIFGDILKTILFVSMVFWFFIFVVSIPLFFIYRDIRSMLMRMQIIPENTDVSLYVPDAGYQEHAKTIFDENPQIAAYIYGHTHDAYLDEENGRAILNTGTWLKLLKRIPVTFGYLPAVYYPTFRLNYFKIYEEHDKIAIEYVEIPKVPGQELSLFQRLLIFNKTPEPGKYIPPKTLL